MRSAEHYAEAERLVNGDPQDIAAAHVHATLALFDMIREIGDQLDSVSRPRPATSRRTL